MKVINKILCFLSLLVLCVPLLCFNVAADDTSDLSLEEYYLTGGTGDWSGIVRGDISGQTVSVDSPYILVINYDNKYSAFDFTDSFARFKYSIACSYPQLKDSNSRTFYYFYRSGRTSTDKPYSQCHISLSPISISNSKFVSDTEIINVIIIYSDELSGSSITYRGSSWNSLAYGQCVKDTSSHNSNILNVNAGYLPDPTITYETVSEVYSNCITEYNGNKVSERPKSSVFKDNIDVKLTPEFGYDMDRKLSDGNSDYFKFEVTNNSYSPVQWCAFIVPEGTQTTVAELNFSGSSDSTTTKYDYLSSNWLYLLNEDYYICDIEEVEKTSIFGSDSLHQYASKYYGTYYFHLLQPGETYSDLVYWENVNIKIFTRYTIRFCAIQNDIGYCTSIDSNEYDNLSNVIQSISHDGDTYSLFPSFQWIDSLRDFLGTSDSETEITVDENITDYALDFTKFETVYEQNFSVFSIPDFTTVAKGGNGVGNGGWDDTLTLRQNYQTKTPTSSGSGLTQANLNYVDNPLLMNGSNVDVSIDNYSIDDVKSYISSCQSFFTLIKQSFSAFPNFIWALICFGITALIVIGIVRYIRG